MTIPAGDHFWFTAKSPNGWFNREDTKVAKNALREPVALAPGNSIALERPLAR